MSSPENNLPQQPDKPPHETESCGEHKTQLAKDLQKIANKNNESHQRNQTFEQHYADMDSEYYKIENDRRINEGKVQLSKYEKDDRIVVTLAAIKVNSEGKAIDGHDYNPASQNATDTESTFDSFIAIAKKPIVVYEGKARKPYDNRDQAVSDSAESGLIQHLAREKNIEAVSGELSDQELLQSLTNSGYRREIAEAYLLSRGLPSLLERNPDAVKDLGIHLHPKAAELGLDGYHAYSQQERDVIVEQGNTEQIFREMNHQIQEYVPVINQLYGQEILIIDKDGTVCLREDLQSKKGMQELWKILSEGSELRHGLLRDSMRIRDQHIVSTIRELHDQGYDVISPYGGSHVITQRPVIEAYFGKPIEKNY